MLFLERVSTKVRYRVGKLVRSLDKLRKATRLRPSEATGRFTEEFNCYGDCEVSER